MSEQRVLILGIPFIHITLKGMVNLIDDHLIKGEKAFVVTANPEIVMAAVEDDNYKRVLDKADYITADGIGIVKAAQLKGQPLPGRVTGFDLFISLLEKSNEQSYTIYLLGAKEDVLKKTIETIHATYPNCKIVGSHHGFFDWNDGAIEEDIRKKEPDLVFVALGFPRQEKWIGERISSFSKGVFIGIGGSFDVLSGEVERAPVIWQKLHMEWLFRLVKQPTRWRRLLALPRFVLKVIGEKIKVKK